MSMCKPFGVAPELLVWSLIACLKLANKNSDLKMDTEIPNPHSNISTGEVLIVSFERINQVK